MLSERVAACAHDLRAWRRDGVMTGLGAEHRYDGVEQLHRLVADRLPA